MSEYEDTIPLEGELCPRCLCPLEPEDGWEMEDCQCPHHKTITPLKKTLYCLLVILTLIGLTVYCEASSTKRGWCSWYSYDSARREGNSGIMANGRRMDDEAFTAASWDYKIGTYLVVASNKSNTSIVVEVTDRGPSKRLYAKGRLLDLSPKAFAALAPLDAGVIQVEISEGG